MINYLQKTATIKHHVFLSAILLLLAAGIPQKANGQGMPTNLDFSSNNFNNWLCYVGYSVTGSSVTGVYFSNTPTGTTPTNGILSGPVAKRHTITSGGSFDSYGGFPIVAPGGNSYSVKIGFDSVSLRSERLRYNIHVPASTASYNLQCKYAIVLDDGQHPLAEQAKFQVVAYDSATGAIVPHANNIYIVGFTMPGFIHHPVNTQVWYLPWKTTTINLSHLAGRTIILEVTALACSQSGHWGYGYFDVTAVSNHLAPKPTACNLQNNTISFTAPPGYQYYRWYDQSFSTALNPALDTNSNITLPLPTTSQYYNLILYPFASTGIPDTIRTNVLSTTISVSAAASSSCAFSGAPIQLSVAPTGGSGGYSYQWYGDTLSLSTTSIANPVATPYIPSNYYVKVADTNGCYRFDTLKIGPAHHQASAGADTTACLGSSLTLNGTATPSSGTYTFSWSPASDLSSSLGPIPVYTPTATGVQKIVLRVDSGTCAVYDTISIQTRSNNFSKFDTAVCAGTTMFPRMLGDTGVSYTWSPSGSLNFPSPAYPGSDQKPSYKADTTTTFTITAQYPGCPTIVKQLTVTALPVPQVSVTTVNGSNCVVPGTSIQLQTTVTGTGGLYTYQWLGSTSSLSALNISNPFATPIGPKSYYLLVTDSNGCKGRDTIVLRNGAYTVSAGTDSTVCNGAAFNLNAIVTPGSGTYSYTWAPAANLSSASIATPLYTTPGAGSQQFVVRVDSGLCTMYDTVTIRTLPGNFQKSDTAVCVGVSIIPFVQGDTTLSFTWSPATKLSFPSPLYSGSNQRPTFLADTTTTFTITAQYPGCTSIVKQLTVSVEPVPIVSVGADTMYKNALFDIAVSATVTPTWFTNYSYTWSANGYIDSVNNANINFSGTTDTNLYITVTTPLGCSGKDTVLVIVNSASLMSFAFVANAFTPGAASNSSFQISRLSPGYNLSSFRVYNRWGVKVFETSNAANGWDGSYKGAAAPTGVYIYVVDAITPKGTHALKKGNVTLLR
jgi:gliding motility-associated-like protein